jgi:hypothetical protein
MSTLTALARAEAVEHGRARPVATVCHIHISARPLVLIPLALAGEACAPLAAMVGTDPGAPQMLVVAQPRNRTQRFAFMDELAGIVVPYIHEFFVAEETVTGGRDTEPRNRYADAPQILLPNRAGIAFTRLLGRSTRFRQTEGEYEVPAAVPLLGRWLTLFAERAEYPGSCLMLAATEILALHWASGQSPAEDLNLAALLNWIDPPPGVSGREAALAAEDPVRWPPAGPATDPTFDNEVLTGLIAAYSRASEGGDTGAQRRARLALKRALTTQLAPTWRLMWLAVGLLRELPAGGHVAARWHTDKDVFTWHAGHLRDGGPPQARRDSAVAAARRLSRLERAQESYAIQRAMDDPLMMAERRLAGEAFAGRVTSAEPDRVDASGRRAVLRPRITIETPDPVMAETGSTLTSAARPAQEARVVSVTAPEGQPARVVLELAKGMGRALTPAPGSVPALGEQVCYATFRDGYRPAAVFPEPEQTPWTHGGPPEPYVPADEDAREAWS